jgi:hypothetical protein
VPFRVRAEWDDAVYEKGIKITDQQLKELPITPADWQREWSYTVRPTTSRQRK